MIVVKIAVLVMIILGSSGTFTLDKNQISIVLHTFISIFSGGPLLRWGRLWMVKF